MTFVIHDGQTCVANVDGKLLMENCSERAKAQHWQLLQVPGVSGVVQIQSTLDASECITGGGGRGSPGIAASVFRVSNEML